jgi:hypothetical protein
VAVDQDCPGSVILATLNRRGSRRTVAVEERTVGRTSFGRVEIDAATIESQAALVARLLALADPDLVLDASLAGVLPDGLDIDPTEVEDALRGAFLRVRVWDLSRPALHTAALPPAGTIAGAFVRTVEARIDELDASAPADAAAPADDDRWREADELRDVLRLGRLLLAGQEVAL